MLAIPPTKPNNVNRTLTHLLHPAAIVLLPAYFLLSPDLGRIRKHFFPNDSQYTVIDVTWKPLDRTGMIADCASSWAIAVKQN